jgi:hypothetical protein
VGLSDYWELELHAIGRISVRANTVRRLQRSHALSSAVNRQLEGIALWGAA